MENIKLHSKADLALYARLHGGDMTKLGEMLLDTCASEKFDAGLLAAVMVKTMSDNVARLAAIEFDGALDRAALEKLMQESLQFFTVAGLLTGQVEFLIERAGAAEGQPADKPNNLIILP